MRYGLIGAAGYVAKKHGEAIKATGGELVHACDTTENVGWLDSINPYCKFTKRYSELLADPEVETVVICTPNHLHYIYAVEALKAGKNVILEKPACLNMAQLQDLIAREYISGKWVSVLMQMRYNKELQALRAPYGGSGALDYLAPRGDWYEHTWKYDRGSSGGLIFNIGIHLLDVINTVFGPVLEIKHMASRDREVTFMTTHADRKICHVRLNIEPQFKASRRLALSLHGLQYSSYDLSKDFTTSHTLAYSEIRKGNRVTLDSCRESLRVAQEIRDR